MLSSKSPSFNPHFPYLFYTTLATWFSVFFSVAFVVMVHLTFFLVCALRPFRQYKQYFEIPSLLLAFSWHLWSLLPIIFHLHLALSVSSLACVFSSCFQPSCLSFLLVYHSTHCIFFSPYRLRGRVVKGMGHIDHVWSYGVREVVSSIPDRGNIVWWVFHPDQATGKVFSSEHAFPSKFWIYLEHCPRGEAVITGHLRLSSMR